MLYFTLSISHIYGFSLSNEFFFNGETDTKMKLENVERNERKKESIWNGIIKRNLYVVWMAKVNKIVLRYTTHIVCLGSYGREKSKNDLLYYRFGVENDFFVGEYNVRASFANRDFQHIVFRCISSFIHPLIRLRAYLWILQYVHYFSGFLTFSLGLDLILSSEYVHRLWSHVRLLSWKRDEDIRKKFEVI